MQVKQKCHKQGDFAYNGEITYPHDFITLLYQRDLLQPTLIKGNSLMGCGGVNFSP